MDSMIRRATLAVLAGLAIAGAAQEPESATAFGDGVSGFNDPPQAVFAVSPAPGADNKITGATPLNVTVNMCRTTDVDEGDLLKYRYDWEGTGEFVRGRCRETNTFRHDGCVTTTACVSDRQPDHEACRSWRVCPFPGPEPILGRLAFAFDLTYADVDADGCADYVSVPWAQTGAIGGGGPQVFIPLADTDGDGRPDSISLDLNGDGSVDGDVYSSGRLAGGCQANTSASRMVGPNWPILVDVDGNGPDAGDTPVVPIRFGSIVQVPGPWDTDPSNGNDMFSLGDLVNGNYTSAQRNTGAGGTQKGRAVGFANGGAAEFEFEQTGSVPRTGTGQLVDSDGDGIFDNFVGITYQDF
jgi:hypothetical protein